MTKTEHITYKKVTVTDVPILADKLIKKGYILCYVSQMFGRSKYVLSFSKECKEDTDQDEDQYTARVSKDYLNGINDIIKYQLSQNRIITEINFWVNGEGANYVFTKKSKL